MGINFAHNPGAGRLKNPKNGSGSYFYLIAIFGYLVVSPICPQRDTYQKVHRGPVYRGGQIYIYTVKYRKEQPSLKSKVRIC